MIENLKKLKLMFKPCLMSIIFNLNIGTKKKQMQLRLFIEILRSCQAAYKKSWLVKKRITKTMLL